MKSLLIALLLLLAVASSGAARSRKLAARPGGGHARRPAGEASIPRKGRGAPPAAARPVPPKAVTKVTVGPKGASSKVTVPAKPSKAVVSAKSAGAKTDKGADRAVVTKSVTKVVVGSKTAGPPVTRVVTKVVVGSKPDAPASAGDEAPAPPPGDRDRERIMRLQETLRDIVHGGVLRRLRVGMRVMEARTGRLFFDRHGGALMDPASNQKVLATTTAIMRLGADWRFRTELSGPDPDAAGVIAGDVYLRGSGDPTVRSADLEALAARLARRGVRHINGAVVADPRRIGTDEAQPELLAEAAGADDGGARSELTSELSPDRLATDASSSSSPPARTPLVVNRGLMLIRVRPGSQPGAPAQINTNPADDSFVIHNDARTKASGRSRVAVQLSLRDGKIQIDVSGRITAGQLGVAFRRKVPHQALYAAVLLRAALVEAGITVRDPARFGSTPAPSVVGLIERHQSAPLAILLRKINKDSDNDQAERVLEAAGAEVYGGVPNTEKGVQLLREVIGELGLPPASYLPRNGSGLGHGNRITADAMAKLLRALYLDPRVGPEILQSLSVGGVDGTTRNRFKGSLAAKRVRAKTGTLHGKSCLSGLVGDGSDVIVFSMLVDGLRGRSLGAVRGAQVSAVNAIMLYVREGTGEPVELIPPVDQPTPGTDFETGEEILESEREVTPPGAASKPGEDPVDAFLKKERERSGSPLAPASSPSPPPPK
jgi:D-alanyl-D-alanine carboxypeptidase/D-alanyl-D-alanine-endopeptidase (penicillin-binding protein 4)